MILGWDRVKGGQDSHHRIRNHDRRPFATGVEVLDSGFCGIYECLVSHIKL